MSIPTVVVRSNKGSILHSKSTWATSIANLSSWGSFFETKENTKIEPSRNLGNGFLGLVGFKLYQLSNPRMDAYSSFHSFEKRSKWESDLTRSFSIFFIAMLTSLSASIWEFPAGLIELGGTLITQFVLITIFGLYYYFTTPTAAFRQTLLAPLPIMIKNGIVVYSAQLFCLSLISWLLGYREFSISYSNASPNFPTSNQVLKEIIIATIIFEIIFYSGHRLLHHPEFYRRFHLRNHRSDQGPFSLYCIHSIEGMFISNSTITAVALQNGHVVSLWLFQALVAWSMMYMHTGRDIAGMMSHETHRVHPRFNFGAVGLLDWCFGTLYASRGLSGIFKQRK